VALALLIIAYGNLVSLPPDGLRTAFDWAFILGSLTFLALLILWAVRIEGMPLPTLGITSANAGRSALLGGALGAVVILPVVLYFIFPLGLDDGIGYENLEEETWGGFLSWALVHQPLGTALFEEVLFRGVLLAKMTVAWGQRQALVASSLTFALWHLVINFRTIQNTEVASPAALAALAQMASLFGLVLGGLFLGLLRQRTGNLASCIVFHWLVVTAMSGTLFLISR
jgi:membrane protease YdiL (CAAX protease family)